MNKVETQNVILRKTIVDAMTLINTVPIITFDAEVAALKGEVHVIQYMYELEEWVKKLNRLTKKMNMVAPELVSEVASKSLPPMQAQVANTGEF